MKLRKKLLEHVIPMAKPILETKYDKDKPREERLRFVKAVETLNAMLSSMHEKPVKVSLVVNDSDDPMLPRKLLAEGLENNRVSFNINLSGKCMNELADSNTPLRSREKYRMFHGNSVFSELDKEQQEARPFIVLGKNSDGKIAFDNYYLFASIVDGKLKLYGGLCTYGASVNQWANELRLNTSVSNNHSYPTTHYCDNPSQFFVLI